MSDQIAISSIRVADRLRTIDPDYIPALAASIQENGLLNPITVGETEEKGQPVYRLIGGFHRLEACRLLNWTVIAANVVRGNEMQRRLMEIDENLCRRDLSVMDRARHVAERARIWEALYPKNHGGKRGKGQVDIMSTWSVTKEAAEKMGLTPRHVRRLCTLDFALAPDVRDRLAATVWANRYSELSRLSSRQPDMQRKLVDELLHPDDPAKSVAAAQRRVFGLPAADTSAQETLVRRLFSIWGRMTKEQKRTVLERMAEHPDFDDLLNAAYARRTKVTQLKLVQGGTE